MTIEQLDILCELKHDLEVLQSIECAAQEGHWITITVPEIDGGKMQFASIMVSDMFRENIKAMLNRVETVIACLPDLKEIDE